MAGVSVKTGGPEESRPRGRTPRTTTTRGAGEGTLAGRTQARTARTSRTAARAPVWKRQRMAPGGGLGSGRTLRPWTAGTRRDGQRPFCRDEFGDDDDGPINTIRTRKKDGKLIIKDDRYESMGGDGGDGGKHG